MTEKTHDRPVAGIVLWTVVALLGAGITVLALMPRAKENAVKTDEKVMPVRVARVGASELPDVLTVPGRVEPAQDVVLGVEKAGRIVRLGAEKGQTVRRGETLLELDSRAWDALRSRAEVEVRESERNMQRWDGLKASGAVSQSDYDAVKQRLDLARISLREAEIHVSQCTISSPFDCLVEARPVDEGEYVPEGAAAFRVLDMSGLKVKASIPENDVTFVKLGETVTFTADCAPGVVMTGKVGFVSMSGSRESNAFDVELAVEHPDPGLRPGMIVEVSVLRRIWTNATVVPLNAVVPLKGEHIAYVAANGRAEARILRIERMVGSRAVVSSGLSAGDMLVIEGQRTLQDGMLIEERP